MPAIVFGPVGLLGGILAYRSHSQPVVKEAYSTRQTNQALLPKSIHSKKLSGALLALVISVVALAAIAFALLSLLFTLAWEN